MEPREEDEDGEEEIETAGGKTKTGEETRSKSSRAPDSPPSLHINAYAGQEQAMYYSLHITNNGQQDKEHQQAWKSTTACENPRAWISLV